jgi:hypothetical protein
VCIIPHQGFYIAFLSHPAQTGLFWSSCRYGEFEGTFVSHILLSQKLDPKEKQVIKHDQGVHVCGYLW